MTTNDERELVQRCINGDADAWSEFVDRYSGLIYWAIKRKLNKYDSTYIMSEAEDIYQLIFALIWEKKSLINVRERGSISPWLVVLASHVTIDFIRKRKREEDYLRRDFKLVAKSQNTKEVVLEKEEKCLLDEAIKLLNEKEKRYIELNYLADKKHREIAEIFNTSVNSVSTIIARAKIKIKKYIESRK